MVVGQMLEDWVADSGEDFLGHDDAWVLDSGEGLGADLSQEEFSLFFFRKVFKPFSLYSKSLSF